VLQWWQHTDGKISCKSFQLFSCNVANKETKTNRLQTIPDPPDNLEGTSYYKGTKGSATCISHRWHYSVLAMFWCLCMYLWQMDGAQVLPTKRDAVLKSVALFLGCNIDLLCRDSQVSWYWLSWGASATPFVVAQFIQKFYRLAHCMGLHLDWFNPLWQGLCLFFSEVQL